MRGRNKSWDSWDERHLIRREFRQDHGGGPEELPHKKPSKKKTPPKKGCPENDGNAHVYAWVKTEFWDHIFYRWACIGCGKRTRRYWKRVLDAPDNYYE